MIRALILPLAVLAACAAPARDMHALAGGPEDEEPAVPRVSDRHALRGMVGYTTSRGDGSFTLAGQYEYRVRRNWGAGGFLDLAFGDEFTPVLGAGLFWHPIENVNLLAAPGFDFEDEDIVIRVGGSIDFEWKKYEIGPAAAVDLAGDGTPLLLAFHISRDF